MRLHFLAYFPLSLGAGGVKRASGAALNARNTAQKFHDPWLLGETWIDVHYKIFFGVSFEFETFCSIILNHFYVLHLYKKMTIY